MNNLVNPETFNDDIIAELFDNVVNPETFNNDTNEKLLFNVVNPLTLMMKKMLYHYLIS